MDISTGLIAKAAAGTAAIAATTTTGVIYGDDIVGFFSKGNEDVSVDQEEQQKEVSLGLPSGEGDEGCKLPTDETAKSCELTKEQLWAVNFDGKTGNLTATTSNKFVLKIEKVTEDTNIFSVENIKFTFTTIPEDVTISPTTTLKKGSNPEFKIKENGKNWSLEKAWKAAELAKKVGLTCESTKICTFDSTTNIFKEESEKWTAATVSGTPKQMKLEEDQKNYNQGFRFFVNNSDITLAKSGSSSETTKLPVGASYEIKREADGWFLKRTWDVKKLAKNFGMTKCNAEDNNYVCDLENGKEINVIDGGNKLTKTTTSKAGKIKFERSVNHNLGFKLTVKDEDITLSGGTVSTGSQIDSLKKDGASYEMKFESKNWFLSKVTGSGE